MTDETPETIQRGMERAARHDLALASCPFWHPLERARHPVARYRGTQEFAALLDQLLDEFSMDRLRANWDHKMSLLTAAVGTASA